MKTPLLFLCFAFSSLAAICQQFSWTPIADLPAPKYAPYSFMIDNRFFVGTGLDSSLPTAVSDLYEYNSTNDSWVARSPIPSGLTMFGSSSFVIDGKAYICNGSVVPGSYHNNGALWQYDPTGDSWTLKDSFAGVPVYTSTAFAIGRYGFLGLGYSPYTSDFYRYDSQSDQWSQINAFPGTARQSACSFVINGIAYVGLGGKQVGSTFSNYNDFYKYDTATGNWTSIASFPGIARRDAAAFTFNNKGYVIGGAGALVSDIYKDVWEYNPQTNSWLQKDSFEVAFRDGSFASNGSFVIVGAGQLGNQHFSKQMWKTGNPNTAITEVVENRARIWSNESNVNVKFEKPLSESGVLSLYDLSGKEVQQINLTRGEASYKISMGHLSAGLYVYDLTIGGSKSNSGKVVISE